MFRPVLDRQTILGSVIQQFGTSRSYGAKADCGGRGLQTLHPYGILCAAQINNLRKKRRILRLATQRQHREDSRIRTLHKLFRIRVALV